MDPDLKAFAVIVSIVVAVFAAVILTVMAGAVDGLLSVQPAYAQYGQADLEAVLQAMDRPEPLGATVSGGLTPESASVLADHGYTPVGSIGETSTITIDGISPEAVSEPPQSTSAEPEEPWFDFSLEFDFDLADSNIQIPVLADASMLETIILAGITVFIGLVTVLSVPLIIQFFSGVKNRMAESDNLAAQNSSSAGNKIGVANVNATEETSKTAQQAGK